MTDLRRRYASNLVDILKASEDATARSRADVRRATATLLATPDAEPKTVDQLLENAMAVAKSERAAAQARLDEIDREAWWKRIWLKSAAEKAKNDADDAYDKKLRYEKRDVAVRARKTDSDLRALTHANHAACKEALRLAREDLKRCEQEENFLKELFEPLSEALDRKAWFGRTTDSLLNLSVSHAKRRDIGSAAKALQSIEFQRLPSEDQFKKWALEYRKVLGGMKQKSAGFSATAAYPGLVKPSLELAKVRFHDAAWGNLVERYEDPPDRWHALPAGMVKHGALIEPVQWVIYWAFLVGSQWFTDSANSADINEDVLTGMLTLALKGQLADSAKSRLLQLGYPKAKANFDFLHLAGKKGESATGADIGLVILLDVGDLRARKVALLQAKVSVDGRADIGSKPSGPAKLTQLQKLRDDERDFFVFYHRTNGTSPPPLPTVTSVKQLRESGTLSTGDLAKLSIVAKPREQGWELATFVAFGLCTPASGLGKEVPDDADPLEAMIAGGRDSLPKYMVVVSLSHDEPGYHKVMSPLHREGYRSIQPRQRRQELQPSQMKEREGPELGD